MDAISWQENTNEVGFAKEAGDVIGKHKVMTSVSTVELTSLLMDSTLTAGIY